MELIETLTETVEAESDQAVSRTIINTESFALASRVPRGYLGSNKENIAPLGFGRQSSKGFHALMKMR